MRSASETLFLTDVYAFQLSVRYMFRSQIRAATREADSLEIREAAFRYRACREGDLRADPDDGWSRQDYTLLRWPAQQARLSPPRPLWRR